MTPKRLIISRSDSIGDVILTLPMAGFLKTIFPETKILFLGSSYTKPIIDCCDTIDEFIDWSAIKTLEKKEQVSRFQSLNADTIVHVFPRKEIAELAKKAGIKSRIGTRNRLYHWWTCNRKVKISRKKSNLHESQLNMILLSHFDNEVFTLSLDDIKKYVHFTAPNIRFDTLNLIDKQRFNLILHPKSKGSAREWGLDNFSRLIDILPPEKFKIFICGTAPEAELMKDTLLAKKNDNLIDLTGKMSLQEYITFIDAADALLAASTGPLHIAAVLGKHALGIYPPIRPMHPGRWSPIGEKAKVFVIDKFCENCRKNGQCSCIQAITPDEIKNYLLNIINDR